MQKGYLTTFLSEDIPFPQVDPDHPVLKNNLTLDYTHFSILYSKDRKQPICAGVNIDGKNFRQKKRKEKADKWLYDTQFNIDKNAQLGKEFYSITNKDFHKGHIVRRLDPSWGNEIEATKAEADTFHFTNASPQHRLFNPAIWLELERNILEKGAVAHDEKIIVFAGPVLSPADKPFIKPVKNERVFIPSRFWKIIVWKRENDSICAVGFVQSQEHLIYNWVDMAYGKEKTHRSPLDDHFENMKFKNDAVYQVNISEIEKLTGLKFNTTNLYLPTIKTKSGRKEVTEDPGVPTAYRGNYRSDSKKEISLTGLTLD